MVLRSFHSVLVKDYGLPEWGSYLIFALCTILVGALIGLVSGGKEEEEGGVGGEWKEVL